MSPVPPSPLDLKPGYPLSRQDQLTVRHLRANRTQLSPRCLPARLLAAPAWLGAERPFGIADPEALAVALHVIDGALPLESRAIPLRARSDGVGEIRRLDGDRGLDPKPPSVSEDPLDGGGALAVRWFRRRLARSSLVRPQSVEALRGVRVDRLEPDALSVSSAAASTSRRH